MPRPAWPIDHSSWDAMVGAHTSAGVVDYPSFARDPRLGAYLAAIARVEIPPDAPLAERITFYLNAYNAVVVRAILDGGSPRSLLGRYSFFMREKHLFAGEAITLWSVEKDRIRTLGDPRIHFALVCASRSCPKISSRAYHSAALESQLHRDAIRFVRDSDRTHIDRAGAVAHISSIFDWYAEDFVDAAGSISAYVADYVEHPVDAEALRSGAYQIEYEPYDWSLNGTRPD